MCTFEYWLNVLVETSIERIIIIDPNRSFIVHSTNYWCVTSCTMNEDVEKWLIVRWFVLVIDQSVTSGKQYCFFKKPSCYSRNNLFYTCVINIKCWFNKVQSSILGIFEMYNSQFSQPWSSLCQSANNLWWTVFLLWILESETGSAVERIE